MFPPVASKNAFAELRGRSELWLPAVRAICARHGLAADGLAPFAGGTNLVFGVGDVVVKLYPPHYARLAPIERAAAERLEGALPVQTPRVEAGGEIDGWPYLVETRLLDRTLEQVWDEMDERARLSIAAELGELVAALHSAPTDGMPDNWELFVSDGIAGCVARHRAQGADERWLVQIPGFLARAAPLAPTPRRAIVTGDVHDGHLTADDRSGRWRLTGLFDFDDAQVGDPEFDLAATGLIVLAGQPALLRTFLTAYGYPNDALNPSLTRRLLAHTLLHRYRPIPWWLPTFVPAPLPATLEEIATAIYDWRM